MIPFLFTNFATLFPFCHGKKVNNACQEGGERKTLLKTPAWNQNFAVKIACCESLFAAWEVKRKKNFALFTFEKFMSLFSGFCEARFVGCFMAQSTLFHSIRLFLAGGAGQSLHDSWWKFNAKVLRGVLRPCRKVKCNWHWTAFWWL